MSRKEAPRAGLLKALVAGRIWSREVAEAFNRYTVRRLRLWLLVPGPHSPLLRRSYETE